MIRRFVPFLMAPFFAVTAHAGTKLLVSASVANAAGGVLCTITNAGPKNVTVTDLRISGTLGSVSMLTEPVVVASGQSFARANFEVFGHCRFTIDGSLKSVRAAACRWEGEEGELGTSFDCVEAR